ncbi:MAG: hypothetical protein JXR65_00090 [Bacteroidales bacterium]|nr:hypothetical protein [Bacteroidales bacterium]
MIRSILLMILIFGNLSGQEISKIPNPGIVSDYKLHVGIVTVEKQQLVSLRQFNRYGKKFLLVADPEKLNTFIIDEKLVSGFQSGMNRIFEMFPGSTYVKAIKAVQKHETGLQDAGITKTFPLEKGIVLSADLCPSTKPLEKILFTNLINTFGKEEKPVPICLSVTGFWIKKHEQDLEWLMEMQKNKKLVITWVNHSYSHRYIKSLPLQSNFLLMKNTNIKNEVLNNEVLMLENGLTPSLFFRFPGLISDTKLVEIISDYGLITLGSDAWLAKGQNPVNGSIVLVHGNGNEPYGIRIFLKLLKSKQAEINNRSWGIYDLAGSLREYFNTTK